MIRLHIGNVFTIARYDSDQEGQTIYDALAYQVSNLEILKRRNPKLRSWDGVKSFFDRRSQSFLTGFVWLVAHRVRQAGHNVEVIDRRVAPAIPPAPDYKAVLEGVTLRDYQVRAIEDFFRTGRGTLKLATGAGKTEIAITVAKSTGLKTLFLTHRVHLLHQTAQRFAKRIPGMKGDIGILGDSTLEPRHVTIATVQTLDAVFRAYDDLQAMRKLGLDLDALRENAEALRARKGRLTKAQADELRVARKHLSLDATSEIITERHRELLEYLASIELLIIDEAHRSGAEQFHRPAMYCTNAYYRMALTATPFMKGQARSDMFLMGVAGPIVAKVTNGELIDAGILARPYFKFFDVTEPGGITREPYRVAYTNGIVHNDYRNRIIAMQAARLVKMGKKTLVIVHEREHGLILEEMLADLQVKYLDGDSTQSERERAIKHLERGRLNVIIATNIFDEGVDADAIGAVILAAGNKSAPALFQRTGRAMRRKEDNNWCLVIDFIDRQHPKLFEHSQRRFELVKQEKGFVIL